MNIHLQRREGFIPPPPLAGAGAPRLRTIVLLLTLVLLLSPAAGGALPPPAAHAPPALAALPADLPDADLVLLLARHAGLRPAPPALDAPGPDDTVERLALRLALRSGAASATREDFAAFATLDPRVARPVATLLAAVDQAWDLQQRATAPLPQEDRRALARLVLDGRGATPEALALGEPVDRAALVDAAILLLDAAESLVLPQLREAADSGAWPAQPLADPLGILRIGGTGDDTETTDRLLQIDARGNDTYLNNAGGTTLLADLEVGTLDYPISISIDFEGDDAYIEKSRTPAQGAGFLGVGLAWDLSGNDHLECLRLCQGAGTLGVGLLRDVSGNDQHLAGDDSLATASLIGILREDAGDDSYRAGSDAGGFGRGREAIGLLWDRQGVDAYGTVFSFAHNRYGWAEQGGRGFFVDEGRDVDSYATQSLGAKVCNDCTWQQGDPASRGRGNDNDGGLAELLTRQGDASMAQKGK